MKNKYFGITYPHFLVKFKWQKTLWRKFFCKRHIHLLDEYWTLPAQQFSHSLCCDACDLRIEIGDIKRYDVEKKDYIEP